MIPETCQNCDSQMESHLPPWHGVKYTVWICTVCNTEKVTAGTISCQTFTKR